MKQHCLPFSVMVSPRADNNSNHGRTAVRYASLKRMRRNMSFRSLLSNWKSKENNSKTHSVHDKKTHSVHTNPDVQEQPKENLSVVRQSSVPVWLGGSSANSSKRNHNFGSRWTNREYSFSGGSISTTEIAQEEDTIVEKAEESCLIRDIPDAEVKTCSFDDIYTVGEELGAGAFAVVHVAKHRRTQNLYAVKMVDTSSLSAKSMADLRNEMNIMASLSSHNPHLVHLHEIYQVPHTGSFSFYIVMELVQGGELFDRIVQKEVYNEKEARDTARVLFEAISFCHSRNVAHRDLKPENLLLTSTSDDSDLKIADFGFAKQYKESEDGFRTLCGSPGYISPEILTSIRDGCGYDVQCDCWSLGVIVYILLGGYAPFDDVDEQRLYAKIVAAKYEFQEEYWGAVSQEAKNFVTGLLTLNPRERLTAERALQHPWLNAADAELLDQDLAASLQEFKRFNAKRKFRAAVNMLIAAQKLADITTGFGFESGNSSGDEMVIAATKNRRLLKLGSSRRLLNAVSRPSSCFEM